MVERLGESDLLAALEHLPTRSPTEGQRRGDAIAGVEDPEPTPAAKRRRADAFLYDWIESEAKYLLDVPLETRLRPAEEIAEELIEQFSSDEELRRKVMEAEHPRRCLQGKILQAFCDGFRRRIESLESDVGPFAELHERSLHALNTVWEMLQAIDAVTEVLHSLPEEERTLLQLRYWEGFSIRETAKRLQMRFHDVFRRLKRLEGKFVAMLMVPEP